jgi:hypothetical protein
MAYKFPSLFSLFHVHIRKKSTAELLAIQFAFLFTTVTKTQDEREESFKRAH